MQRLISQDLINKYLLKEVEHNGEKYKTIFRYLKDDQGKDVTIVDSYVMEVGFCKEGGQDRVRPDGKVDSGSETGRVYLPSVNGFGLVQKNMTMWYPVCLVLPPIEYIPLDVKVPYYLPEVLNTDASARKLSDFLPLPVNGKPILLTPLMQELSKTGVVPLSDIHRWTVLDMPLAILEMFNLKIRADIARSTRGGFKGISAAVRAVHTLIQAFMRYHGEEEDELPPDARQPEEEDLLGTLGKISIEDRNNVLVIHEVIKDTPIDGVTCPIDFCTCSQARPMTSGRLKDGVTIEGGKFIGTPSFPYTKWRRAIPGILSDDPRRVIVSRAITRAMTIEGPDRPWVETDVSLKVDSVSLPGVRMTHELNYEDGIVVSETFARKMAAYKIVTERFAVSDDAEVMCCKREFTADMDKKEAARMARRSRKETDLDFIVRPGDVIAVVTYRDADGDMQVSEKRTKSRVPVLVTRVEEFAPPTDLDENGRIVRFVYLAYIPLQVGDKVSDGHGNKATISVVLEDTEMPVCSDGRMCHYIATPYLMKRLAMGAEIEDRIATVAHRFESHLQLSSDDPPTIEETMNADDMTEMIGLKVDEEDMNYAQTVSFRGKEYHNIPVSLRRMFRLDNNCEETLISKAGVTVEDNKRTGRNIRLGLDLVTLLSRGAKNIANEVIEESASKGYVETYTVPLLNAIADVAEGETVKVDQKLPQELLGNPVGTGRFRNIVDSGELENTSADPRLKEQYGVIKHRNRTVVIPPHEVVRDLRNGTVIVNQLAIAANKVVAEIMSEKIVSRMIPKVGREINQPNPTGMMNSYKRTLAFRLSGKNGIIRESLLPVFPHTIRAVITPFVDETDRDPFLIAIPRRAFNRMKRSSERFGETYLRKENWRCILKRDPVHREQSVMSVRFTLWENGSIGISPLLIGALDGDFDGDAGVAMFPIGIMARTDMSRLRPEFEEIFEGGKQLTDVHSSSAMESLINNVGWVSTFAAPHSTDVLKNQGLFNMLRRGATHDELSTEAVKAGRDFSLIKDGTAYTGALGLQFIYSRCAERPELLKSSMELYHTLAQDTLDAKAGTPVLSMDVVTGFRQAVWNISEYSRLRKSIAKSKREVEKKRKGALLLKHEQQAEEAKERIVEALRKLDFDDYECTMELMKMIDEVGACGGKVQYFKERFPVLGAMQPSLGQPDAKMEDILEIAGKIIEKEPMGEGIWEKLFDHLLRRGGIEIFSLEIRSIGEIANSVGKMSGNTRMSAQLADFLKSK
jgi:hypothetical protein